jgi:hypothetical protein
MHGLAVMQTILNSTTIKNIDKIEQKSLKYFLSYFGIPIYFTGPKMFCAGPKFLSQPKNLTAFSASSKTFVPAQKPILLNANHLFVWHKMFVTSTICK